MGTLVSRLLLTALCIAATVLGAPPALAVNQDPDKTIVTDGFVFSIDRVGSKVYVGGTFKRVGPRTGPGAGLDATTGQDLGLPEPGTASGSPFVPGTFGSFEPIEKAVSDGSGGWYVAGQFATFGGQTRPHLVHINANKTLDLSFNPAPNGAISALVRDGSNLYVGGEFTNIGGQARTNLAKLNATTGAADATWNPGANAQVTELALSADNATLYVAGFSLSAVGGQNRSRIGAVSTTGTGAATAFDPGPDSFVTSIDVSGTTVYAGGAFTSIGGENHTALAALNGTTGAAVTAFAPNTAGGTATVRAVEVSGSTIFVAGDFTSIGGQPRLNIAQLNLSDGSATTTFNPGVSQAPGGSLGIGDLEVVGSTLYVGGFFATIGGQQRNNLAALNTANGTVSAWDPSPISSVATIAATSDVVYVGGRFSSASTVPQAGLAAIDAASGQLTGGAPTVSGGQAAVRSMQPIGNTLYIGGSFGQVGGQSRSNLAAFDTTTGNVTPGFIANATGTVLDLDSSGSTLYVAGFFPTIAGQPRDSFAAINTTNSSVLSWDPEVNGASPIGSLGPHAIAVGGDSVYLGGDFTTVKGTARNWAAAVDPATAAIKPWNPDPNTGPNIIVESILPAGATVYISGAFTQLGGSTPSYLAEVSATSGGLTAWDPAATSYPGAAALANSGTTLFAAGQGFQSVAPRSMLVEFERSDGDVTPWAPQFTGFSPAGQPETMYLGPDGTVYVGGNFTALNQVWQQGFAAFSGGTPPLTEPANTARPQISGTAAVGQSLSCSPGTWTGSAPLSFTYSWLRDGAVVAGPQAASTYTVASGDAGRQLACRVVASNAAGSNFADSSAVTVPAGGGGGLGGKAAASAFGAKTLLSLSLRAKRIKATGPVKIVVANGNNFKVGGVLSGRTSKAVATAAAKRKRKKKTIKLKAKSFTVAASGKTTVALKLPKKLRRLLKRKRKLSLAITAVVKDPAGNERTVKKKLSPKLKKKKRKKKR